MTKKNIDKIIMLLFSILLGALLVIHIRNNTQKYDIISLKSLQMMENEIINTQEEINDLSEAITGKYLELQEYKKVLKEKGSISSVLEKELETYKMISNMVDVHGSGIMIRMEDNDSGYIEGKNLNMDIIHDMDVIMIINDLKAAGAEAISINGKRLLVHSEVRCGGPIIRINDEEVAAPFIIKAIGNPKFLSASINAPNTYASNLRKYFGIKIETRQSDDILVSKYSKEIIYKYAKSVADKEGE